MYKRMNSVARRNGLEDSRKDRQKRQREKKIDADHTWKSERLKNRETKGEKEREKKYEMKAGFLS